MQRFAVAISWIAGPALAVLPMVPGQAFFGQAQNPAFMATTPLIKNLACHRR